MSIDVSYHDRFDKLQDLAGPRCGPFYRPEWFALLAEGDPEAFVVQATTGAKQAALALRSTEAGIVALTNWFAFSYGPLGDDKAALTAIARELRGRGSRVLLAPVADEDGTASLLEDSFRQAGWIVFRQVCDENHVLRVEGRTFAEYWAGRPGALRTTVRRKGKKVETAVHTRFESDAWSEYRAVYDASWKPPEERPDLLEAFARMEGDAGRIRLGIAHVDGAPVAAQFWTVEDGTAYIHKLAHSEAAATLSAGSALSAAMFEHVIDVDQVEVIDFGTGSDGYKRDWVEDMRPRYRLECLDWRDPRRWPHIGTAILRRLAHGMSRG